MIKILRVDHRLIHGQVVFSWVKQLNIDHIIVGDDRVQADAIASMALKMAKPNGVKLDIVKISEVKKIVESNLKNKIMILVKGPAQAEQLVNDGLDIKEINYGGISKKDNSIQYGQAVFLNPEELNSTKNIINKGVKVYIQQIPSSPIEKENFG